MGTARQINDSVRTGTQMFLTSRSSVVLQATESGSFPARRAVEEETELASTKHSTGLN